MVEIIVVGDRFVSFTQDKQHVLTVGEFSDAAWDGRIQQGQRIIIGQGVEFDRFTGALEILKGRHGIEPCVVNFHILADQRDPVHHRSVHKHRAENMLISRPQRISPVLYQAWLSLQDSGEMLNDHMTGQHIQGIVLTEAGRQMLISTSEHYLLDEQTRGNAYFVLNTLSSEYQRFAFPIPTKIEFHILQEKSKPGKSLKVDCEIRFIQNDELVACVSSAYCAYVAEVIGARERMLAAAAGMVSTAALAGLERIAPMADALAMVG